MRGKPIFGRAPFFLSGLIPACAGKTSESVFRSALRSAHPRVCGENFTEDTSCLEILGSSPRVRGKPVQRSSKSARCRLIPACAGKTVNGKTWKRKTEAHPRVCGENPAPAPVGMSSLGSSPRVRGKRQSTRENTVLWGLIPACAGKTPISCFLMLLSGAHPRVCGENGVCGTPNVGHPGSSPRVRGKLPCIINFK